MVFANFPSILFRALLIKIKYKHKADSLQAICRVFVFYLVRKGRRIKPSENLPIFLHYRFVQRQRKSGGNSSAICLKTKIPMDLQFAEAEDLTLACDISLFRGACTACR